MRWKKLFTIAAVVLVVMIAAVYVILLNLDFNRFKPQIAQLVLDATGRKLTIEGSIDIGLGLRPTLVAEDVGLENAAWGSQPELARVKRLEVQLAFLPLIWGELDFAELVLIEPEVIVEFDSAGTSNFSFGPPSEEKTESAIPPPPLIFSDVLIEKGLFTYQDPRSNVKFSIRIDRLVADIPGFDKPLQLDFEGAFDDKPFMLKGTVGPIWAWVEPGYSLPAKFTVKSADASATIKGELRDPTKLKDLAFDITVQGSSVAGIARLAGLSDVPELGALELTARVSDPEDQLGIEKLNVRIGTEELAAISLTGDVKDLLALQGINLDFSVRGKDSANLTQLGLPALPERGAFQITAQISDPEAKAYTVSDLSIVLGDNEVNGQIDLNLAQKVPFLTAGLRSQRFRYGQLKLDLKMTDLVEKPAIEKIDLKIGNPDLAKIDLIGRVDDLMELQGVDIKFQASGKDLANLKKFTGQSFPVRGAFSAAGKVLIPIHQNLKIPDLKITAGKNNITGSLNLDLRGDRPNLEAKLSLPKLDLPSVLLPELARQEWAKGLRLPVRLDVALEGFAPEIALKKMKLIAGSMQSAELRLTGSVQNLVNLHGIDLNFYLQGNEVEKLKDITGQTYIFTPVPGQGKYSISGKISNPVAMDFKVEDFKLELAGTELIGWVDVNLAAQPAQYEVKVSARKFNMKPFPIPKEAAYAQLNKLDNLGPLKIHSKVTVTDDGLSLQQIDLQAGSEQLAAIEVKGSIKSLNNQSGINLDLNIWGKDIANLKKITDKSVPFKGAYGLSGKLTDPAQKKYNLSDLKLKLGNNAITGSLDLNLNDKQLRLATDLAAPKFTLQPLTLPALESIARIEDLGPLKLAFKLAGVGQKMALDNLDFHLGREDLIEVLLKGTISDLASMRGMKLAFTTRGKDLSDFEKMGGPAIPFQGTFDISGELIDPAPKIYKIPSFTAAWGDNKDSGWLELDLSGQRPYLKAELSSNKLDLRPLFATDKKKGIEDAQSPEPVAQKDQESKTKTQGSKPAAPKTKIFPAEPLKLEGLQALDADLKFRDKQVLLPGWALNDVIVDVRLKDGSLEIKPFKFTIGGGKADVRFALRSQDKPAGLAVALDINQLEIGPMLDQLGSERTVDGNMDAAFNLDGSGDSVAAMMADLNGYIHIAMKDGRAASDSLEQLEKWLGSGILRMLNPFQEKREFTPVNCFVNKIEIKDGLANVKILLDTDRTSIFGAGDVDLKTEGLDLGIKPTPKKGAGPADVSFSFRELSQPFRLGGTLANPSLVIDAGRTAFVIGKFAGALALGPIGIGAFFADVSVGNKDPCAIALQGLEKGGRASEGAKAQDTTKSTDPGSQKKKEEKSGGFLKRLFGK